jgi:hypothetical protein
MRGPHVNAGNWSIPAQIGDHEARGAAAVVR